MQIRLHLTFRAWCSLLVLCGLAGCRHDIPVFPAEQAAQPYLLEQPPHFPQARIPQDNVLTEARVALGRRLFFDPILSRDRTVSCGSCHHPDKAFTDGRPLSMGIDGQVTSRNAIGLFNAAFSPQRFNWDGLVPSLELQVFVPIEAHNEMDLPIPQATERLRNHPEYPALFQAAYQRQPDTYSLTRALAAYQRTLVSAGSRYDDYRRTGNADFLSDAELRGMALFFSERGECFHCHNGELFRDGDFHNTGIHPDNPDPGLAAFTGRAQDQGKFHTPSLRNLRFTAPYMHDGSFATLQEVIEHYNKGGLPNPNRSIQIKPLNLTPQEKQDLVAFLLALSDEEFIESHKNDGPPSLPPPAP
ncbi:MAG: cytochrome-c peroxidase [Bacteroidetes bacterium]|nr:cytochrome-c peroxidase [Bacteroidota bacterium]